VSGPAASVLLSTYENPAWLRLALTGYGRQTTRDFEVVVCDDGSGPETAAVVEEMSGRLPVPVRHVRQEDRGNRKGRIVNEGAARSGGGLLIFSDQDCVPHRAFVAEHAGCAAPRTVGFGRVVRLGREISERADEAMVASGGLEAGPLRLAAWALSKRARAVEAGLYLGRVPWLRDRGTAFHQLFGGNFSCPRGLFEEVNGYDERMEGWGREDTELGWRLRNAGASFRTLKFRAILYHLWHASQPRERLEENDRLLEETIRTGRVRCDRGLADHDPDRLRR
jgi:glycosyltransferase involved in cell wall biosynthesis